MDKVITKNITLSLYLELVYNIWHHGDSVCPQVKIFCKSISKGAYHCIWTNSKVENYSVIINNTFKCEGDLLLQNRKKEKKKTCWTKQNYFLSLNKRLSLGIWMFLKLHTWVGASFLKNVEFWVLKSNLECHTCSDVIDPWKKMKY